ncbi:hypothetical protein [Streptomyces sp. NPDC001070]
MTSVTAFPQPRTAVCVLRAAARSRALRIAVFLGALLVLGFLFGDRAQANEPPTAPASAAVAAAAPSGDGSLRPVARVVQRQDTRSPSGTAARPAARGGRIADPVHDTARALPGTDAAEPALSGTRTSVRGALRGGHLSPVALTGPVLDVLPPRAANLVPRPVVPGTAPSAGSPAPGAAPADAATAPREGLVRKAPRFGPTSFPAAGLPGPPGTDTRRAAVSAGGDDGPFRLPAGRDGGDPVTTTAQYRSSSGGDPQAAAFSAAAFPRPATGVRGRRAGTAPLLEQYREVLEFPG